MQQKLLGGPMQLRYPLCSSFALEREDCEKMDMGETSWADQRDQRYSSKNVHQQAIPGDGSRVLSELSGGRFSSHLVHV